MKTYLWLLGNNRDQHSIKDDQFTVSGTLSPEFQKCYTFQNCSFPMNATMEVSVMEQSRSILGTSSESVVGSTILDIEDRWFHPEYQRMMQ